MSLPVGETIQWVLSHDSKNIWFEKCKFRLENLPLYSPHSSYSENIWLLGTLSLGKATSSSMAFNLRIIYNDI